MKNTLPETLARRVSYLREMLNLTREELASKSNLEMELIDSIEDGTETFLSNGIRQKIAKGLKISPNILKQVEKKPIIKNVTKEETEAIESLILQGKTEDLSCPQCGKALIAKVLTLYDLYDKPMKHAKARCSQCPFQIK